MMSHTSKILFKVGRKRCYLNLLPFVMQLQYKTPCCNVFVFKRPTNHQKQTNNNNYKKPTPPVWWPRREVSRTVWVSFSRANSVTPPRQPYPGRTRRGAWPKGAGARGKARAGRRGETLRGNLRELAFICQNPKHLRTNKQGRSGRV